jgi:hypothetical protein
MWKSEALFYAVAGLALIVTLGALAALMLKTLPH